MPSSALVINSPKFDYCSKYYTKAKLIGSNPTMLDATSQSVAAHPSPQDRESSRHNLHSNGDETRFDQTKIVDTTGLRAVNRSGQDGSL